ncbi:hypothetical protein [Nocardia rhizosphaerae]|uniref:Uncharacterized protein n=1 Tax=Nocardia rhizosphaerae TaxID=1691571 RepID=A0ABV8LDY8_9NOCA
MTAEEIRAEAIERVAQADFAYTEKFMGRAREWDAATESDRKFHREMAAVAVDALGDLLPTGVDVQHGWIDRNPEGAIVHREPACHRYVTAWKAGPE